MRQIVAPLRRSSRSQKRGSPSVRAVGRTAHRRERGRASQERLAQALRGARAGGVWRRAWRRAPWLGDTDRPVSTTTTRIESVGSASASCVACGSSTIDERDRCGYCGVPWRAGPYRVLEVIARSAHGAVYRAVDDAGAIVALKELVFALVPSTQAVDAFEREGAVLSALSHPAIPKFRGTFTVGSGVSTRLYLAQDFQPGETLEARARTRHLAEEEVLALGRQLLEVLVYLHEQWPPVLHRDLKPANIIVTPDGQLRVVDFGSARAVSAGGTHGSTLVGTFGYMAPEQLGGSVEPRSDLYGVGATLVHLLTRRPPHELMRDGRTLELDAGLHLSPRTRSFLQRLVAVKPQDRFASARAALTALDTPPGVSPRALCAVVAAAVLAPFLAVGAAWLSGASHEAASGRADTQPPRVDVQAPVAREVAPPALVPALSAADTLDAPPVADSPVFRFDERTMGQWDAARAKRGWLLDVSGAGRHLRLRGGDVLAEARGLHFTGAQDLHFPDHADFTIRQLFTVGVAVETVDLEPGQEAVLAARGDPAGAYSWKLSLIAPLTYVFSVRGEGGEHAEVRGEAVGRSTFGRPVRAEYDGKHHTIALYEGCKRLAVTGDAPVPARALPQGAQVTLLRGFAGMFDRLIVERVVWKPQGDSVDGCSMSADFEDER